MKLNRDNEFYWLLRAIPILMITLVVIQFLIFSWPLALVLSVFDVWYYGRLYPAMWADGERYKSWPDDKFT